MQFFSIKEHNRFPFDFLNCIEVKIILKTSSKHQQMRGYGKGEERENIRDGTSKGGVQLKK